MPDFALFKAKLLTFSAIFLILCCRLSTGPSLPGDPQQKPKQKGEKKVPIKRKLPSTFYCLILLVLFPTSTLAKAKSVARKNLCKQKIVPIKCFPIPTRGNGGKGLIERETGLKLAKALNKKGLKGKVYVSSTTTGRHASKAHKPSDATAADIVGPYPEAPIPRTLIKAMSEVGLVAKNETTKAARRKNGSQYSKGKHYHVFKPKKRIQKKRR